MMVSIVGDSISTYKGFNPSGYAVYYDEEMCARNGLNDVYDTWWAKVNQYLRAYICVNNSYSGSRVTGECFPAAISKERLMNLHTERYSPDMILIYIGFNDFGYGVKVWKDGLISMGGNDRSVFADAYEIMLSTLKRQYPDAVIVCGTLMRTFIRDRINWIFPEEYAGAIFEDYNKAIRKACKKQKCLLADISALNMSYETLDGTHPTANGHRTIAQAWIECIKKLNL